MLRYLGPAEFPGPVVANPITHVQGSKIDAGIGNKPPLRRSNQAIAKGAVFALVAGQRGAPDQWMRWVTAAWYVANARAYAKNRFADQRPANAMPAGDCNDHAFVNLCSSSRWEKRVRHCPLALGACRRKIARPALAR